MLEKIVNLVISFIKGAVNPVQTAKWNIKTEYRSQLKNLKSPYSTCFPTSIYMAAKSIGLDLISPDYITGAINSLKYREWVRKNMSQYVETKFSGKYHVLWAVQAQFLQDEIDKAGLKIKVLLNSKTKLSFIIEKLKGHYPVVVNIHPVYKNKTLGHVVATVDYETLKRREFFTVDDPFGSLLGGYKDRDGNDVFLTKEEFEAVRDGMSITFKTLNIG